MQFRSATAELIAVWGGRLAGNDEDRHGVATDLLTVDIQVPQALFAVDALGVLGPVCPLLACVREGASCAATCTGGRSRELWAFRDRGGGDAKRVKWWTANGSNCSGRMEEGMAALGGV